MSSCYQCGNKGESGLDLKQMDFFVEIGKVALSLKREFWKDPNYPAIPGGLCKKCMADASEEGAQVLRALKKLSKKGGVKWNQSRAKNKRQGEPLVGVCIP